MSGKFLRLGALLIALGGSAAALAADAGDANNSGAAAAATNKAPPEKVAPKPTPSADAIAPSDATPGGVRDPTPLKGNEPSSK